MKLYIGKDKFCPLTIYPRKIDLPFHFEIDKYELVDNVEDADVIPVMVSGAFVEPVTEYEKIKFIGKNIKKQLLLVLLHTHTFDGEGSEFYENEINKWKLYCDNVVIVHTNHNCLNEQIYYDFYWNRQKAYFVDYDKFDLSPGRLWTNSSTKKMFKLDDIKLNEPKKKFLVPNKVHDDGLFRNKVRKRIIDTVLEEDCYYSDTFNCVNLWPEEKTKESVDSISRGVMEWNPIANEYYRNSIFSYYCETIASSINNTKCVTEKTYNALIKGHFIIPFGYPNMISDLKSIYGFKFPTWVDYNYDTIVNDDDRLSEFLVSFSKLRSLSRSEMVYLYYKDVDILEHNRQIFFDRPYDSLYDKIKIELEKRKLL